MAQTGIRPLSQQDTVLQGCLAAPGVVGSLMVTLHFLLIFLSSTAREIRNRIAELQAAEYSSKLFGCQCLSSSSVTVYARWHHYAVCCYRHGVVCLSVCRLYSVIEMPFALWTQLGSQIPHGDGHFEW